MNSDSAEEEPRRNHKAVNAGDVQMLDQTLQGLFGLGLKLEYCVALIDESPQQAREGIEAAISSLAELMEPIRARIMQMGCAR